MLRASIFKSIFWFSDLDFGYFQLFSQRALLIWYSELSTRFSKFPGLCSRKSSKSIKYFIGMYMKQKPKIAISILLVYIIIKIFSNECPQLLKEKDVFKFWEILNMINLYRFCWNLLLSIKFEIWRSVYNISSLSLSR